MILRVTEKLGCVAATVCPQNPLQREPAQRRIMPRVAVESPPRIRKASPGGLLVAIATLAEQNGNFPNAANRIPPPGTHEPVPVFLGNARRIEAADPAPAGA